MSPARSVCARVSTFRSGRWHRPSSSRGQPHHQWARTYSHDCHMLPSRDVGAAVQLLLSLEATMLPPCGPHIHVGRTTARPARTQPCTAVARAWRAAATSSMTLRRATRRLPGIGQPHVRFGAVAAVVHCAREARPRNFTCGDRHHSSCKTGLHPLSLPSD